jgi:hypothetical protein
MMYGCAIADIIERQVLFLTSCQSLADHGQFHRGTAYVISRCDVRSMLYRRLYSQGDGSRDDCSLWPFMPKQVEMVHSLVAIADLQFPSRKHR